jgi:CDP-diacylglycerol--glycerol-3-phosphate 3-phosphatidyltransferase
MTCTALRIVPLSGAAACPSPLGKRALTAGVYAVTVGRLALAAAAIGMIVLDRGLLAVCLIACFVVIDIYDGEIARRHGLETGTRRFLDGAVDKASIHAVAAVVCMTVDGAMIFWFALIVRDVAQAAIGSWILWRHRVIAAGAKWHRSYTLAVAAWGGAMILFREPFVVLAAVALALGLLTLVDYLRQCIQFDNGTWRGGLAALEIEK